MRVLTGIQPSGSLHIGNYFGSIKQMVDAQKNNDTFAFIANYHAMTSVQDGTRLSELTMQCATDFLALGIDPSKNTFWVQSDVKEVLELYWILSSLHLWDFLRELIVIKTKLQRVFMQITHCFHIRS